MREATAGHPADSHDIESIADIRQSSLDAARDASQYSALSTEYAAERDKVRAAANAVAGSVQRLAEQVKKADDDAPLDSKLLDAVSVSANDMLRAAHQFHDAMDGDEAKDASREKGSRHTEAHAKEQFMAVLKHYQYGTDLYRTYVNLLPVRTGSGFVLAFPSYRDASLKNIGDSALRRVQSAFTQLYGPVSVVSAPSDVFIEQLGSVHCLTKVLPEGTQFARRTWSRSAVAAK